VINYIIFAIIQGLTEFLPISSSGHLLIANNTLQITASPFFYIVVLHLGTMFSLVVFFFKDIKRIINKPRMLKLILVVTLVAGALGFVGKDFFERLFHNYKFVFPALFINGLILIFANRKINVDRKPSLNYLDSVILGFVQVIAMIPGISRSGLTISCLLLKGLNKHDAFKLSFLVAIPVIFISFAYEFIEHKSELLTIASVYYYTIGFFVAFIVGYISLFFLSFIIKRSRLDLFGYYCLFASLLIFS